MGGQQPEDHSMFWFFVVLGIIVVIVIGFLSYFGVLTPSGGIPERCAFPVQLQCGDYKVAKNGENTDVMFTLTNGFGEDITIVSANMSANPDTLINNCFIRMHPNGEHVLNTEKITLNFTNCLAPKNLGSVKKKYTIRITIQNESSTHSITGEILAKREDDGGIKDTAEKKCSDEILNNTHEYNPVCGWYNSNIKCFAYPCASNFANSYLACKNPDVEYYTLGDCPA